MRILIYLVLILLLTCHTAFAQKAGSNGLQKNGSFEFKIGYSNFDKEFDGVFAVGGYNYNFNKYLVGQANALFDIGKIPKVNDIEGDSYWSGTALVGAKGMLPLFKGNKLRVGPDFGIMVLDLDRREITGDTLLFPIVLGFSAAYLFEIKPTFNIGLTYSKQYTTNFDFTNQRFGLVLNFR